MKPIPGMSVLVDQTFLSGTSYPITMFRINLALYFHDIQFHIGCIQIVSQNNQLGLQCSVVLCMPRVANNYSNKQTNE